MERLTDCVTQKIAEQDIHRFCYNTIAKLASLKGYAMTQPPGPIIRLIGDLRSRGVDWNMSEFVSLFERLGATVEGTGAIKRYVRYYGYYVLPVLYGDRFVARFEPGQDKKSRALVIKNWWWEQDVEKSDEMYNNLKECFQRFLGYLNAEKITIKKSLVKREGLDWLP